MSDHMRPTTASSHGGSTREGAGPTTAPGKQTLVDLLVQPIPASTSSSTTPATPDVKTAAAHGISGNSEPLPHRNIIERCFGRHPIDVKAHTDTAAAEGSRAMGAQAFATGDHVAFGTTPDLHTSAHEAAHVVQQRSGVQLKGGIGEAGDPHEQHANHVADRVVAGKSAEDLLDLYSSSASSATSTARVQRQSTSPAPAAPAAGSAPSALGPAASAHPDAYHAPTSAHDPDAPASRNTDWEHVQIAAADKHAQEALDISWIDALPEPIKSSIDGTYADSVAEHKAADMSKSDSELSKIAKEIAQRQNELRTAAIARLAATDPTIKHKSGKPLDAALAADPEYSLAKKQLQDECTNRLATRQQEIRAAADGPMSAGNRADTVTKPGTAKVPRPEGKMLARTNFMSWAIDLLGSAEAAKRHFLSIREVSGVSGMFLIAEAATRFEQARAAFQAAHDGYTFPKTDVALGLRGFHEARQGIGMLGHALGCSLDLFANDNPNQKTADTGNYGYLLDRFGGQGDKRGRSIMNLGAGGEQTIAQLGDNTAANHPTPDGEAMVQRIHDQFEEMSATSERLRASMAIHLAELQETRDQYFNSMDTAKQVDQAAKDEKNGDKIADQRMKAEKFEGDKAARREEIKAELRFKKTQLVADLKAAKDGVSAKLKSQFADWAATIDTDIAAVRARQATSEEETAMHLKAKQELDAVDAQSPGAMDTLNTLADKYQLKKMMNAQRAVNYKLILQRELTVKHKPRASTDPLSSVYLHNELAELEAWQARIHDPKFVFGQGVVVPSATATSPAAPPAAATTSAIAPPAASRTPASAGNAPASASTATGAAGAPASSQAAPAAKHWQTKMEATHAPLMQIIEHGFLRNDAMPERAGADQKQVFNSAVAATLARYGFAPGAAFRDAMHFDYVAGYSAVPGGRSQSNMSHTKYGPSGDIPAPASKASGPANKDPQ